MDVEHLQSPLGLRDVPERLAVRGPDQLQSSRAKGAGNSGPEVVSLQGHMMQLDGREPGLCDDVRDLANLLDMIVPVLLEDEGVCSQATIRHLSGLLNSCSAGRLS